MFCEPIPQFYFTQNKKLFQVNCIQIGSSKVSHRPLFRCSVFGMSTHNFLFIFRKKNVHRTHVLGMCARKKFKAKWNIMENHCWIQIATKRKKTNKHTLANQPSNQSANESSKYFKNIYACKFPGNTMEKKCATTMTRHHTNTMAVV